MKDQGLHLRIGELINKHDPAQLFGHGAPEDEYTGEARLVQELMSRRPNSNSVEIAEELKAIFTARFSLLTVQNNLPAYAALANDLAMLFQNRKQ
jgi:hypothetical protein